jgi:hypothetical protein
MGYASADPFARSGHLESEKHNRDNEAHENTDPEHHSAATFRATSSIVNRP